MAVDHEEQRMGFRRAAAQLSPVRSRTVRAIGGRAGAVEVYIVRVGHDRRQGLAVVEHVAPHFASKQTSAAAAGIETEYEAILLFFDREISAMLVPGARDLAHEFIVAHRRGARETRVESRLVGL